MTRWLRACVLAGVLASGASASAEPKLKDGDRVLFYGDSSSGSRQMADRVESFFALRYPSLDVTFRTFEAQPDTVLKDAVAEFAELVRWTAPTLIVLSLGPRATGSGRVPDDAALKAFENNLTAFVEAATPGSRFVLTTPTAPPTAFYAKYLAVAVKTTGRRGEPLTNPYPYGTPTPEEGAHAHEQTITRMADALRNFAAARKLALIDAHKTLSASAADLEKGIEALPMPGREPREIASRRNVLWNAYGVNLAAGMLLDDLGVEPVAAQVRFDWQNGSAEASCGPAELSRPSDKVRRLVVKSLPIPWDLGERSAAWWELVPAAKYCRLILQVSGAPPGGVVLSGGDLNTIDVTAAELDKGFNLACGGPAPAAKGTADLILAIGKRNLAAARLSAYQREKYEEPEFQEPYQAMLRATQMWLEAHEKVLARTPRTMDIVLELKAK